MKDTTVGIKIASVLLMVVFIYLVAVTFLPMPPTGEEHSKTIVGFMLGTVFSTLINYYWGNSSKGQTPSPPPMDDIDDIAKEEAARIESTRIEAAKDDAAKAESKRIEEARIEAAKIVEEASKKLE